MDDFFRSAYQEFEEKPSTALWEKINAGLDKKETVPDKRKFLLWRKATVCLLLLLISFILLDSNIFNRSSAFSNQKKNTQPSYSHDTSVTLAGINNVRNSTSKPNIIIIENEKYKTEKNHFPDNFSLKEKYVQLSNTKLSFKKINNTLKKITRDDSLLLTSPFIIASTNVKPEETPEYFLKEDKSISNNTIPGNFILQKNLTSKLPAELNITILPPISVDINNSFSKKAGAIKTKRKETKSFTPFWAITPFVSYQRAGYRLTSDFDNNITEIKHNEVHEPSFSGGVLATRQFTKYWGLQTGLLYSNTAIGISPQKTYAFQGPTGDISYKYITSSGYTFIKPGFGAPPSSGDSLTTSEAKHIIQTITVPLILKYTLSHKKVSIIPGAGIEANFITKANLEVEIEDAFNREIVIVNKLNGTKSFYWSAVIDAEIQYKLNKKLYLNLRPIYRFALSPMTKNNVVETFPNSLGLGLGVTFRF